MLACEPAREEFMRSNSDSKKLKIRMKQLKVNFKPVRESDGMVREIIWGALKHAVEIAMENVARKELEEGELLLRDAEEWESEETQPRIDKKEEDFLLKMLKELDIKDRKEEARKKQGRSDLPSQRQLQRES